MKIRRWLIISLFLCVTTLSASQLDIARCTTLLNRFSIRPDLKSPSGWMRVCKYDKLQLYTDNNLSIIDKDILCKCLTMEEETDRSIERGKRND